MVNFSRFIYDIGDNIYGYYKKSEKNILLGLKICENMYVSLLLYYNIYAMNKGLVSLLTYVIILNTYNIYFNNDSKMIYFINILNIIGYNIYNVEYFRVIKRIYQGIILFFITKNIFMEIYDKKIYYLNKVLDFYFKIKLYIKRFNKKKINGFHLDKVELYINLKDKIDITLYFETNHIDNINKELIDNIFKNKMISMDIHDDIRLKIYYEYHNDKYIMYYPYKELTNKTNDTNYYLPYPPFDENIMENYRHDIIYPYYNENIKKKLFYSFFHMDCKDIFSVKVNDKENEILKKYFNEIKSPFSDYGLLYNVPVKLKWILFENNIDTNEFKELYFKFLNSYLCEEEMDLKDHELVMTKDNLDNIFITNRMKKILDEKDKLIKKNK